MNELYCIILMIHKQDGSTQGVCLKQGLTFGVARQIMNKITQGSPLPKQIRSEFYRYLKSSPKDITESKFIILKESEWNKEITKEKDHENTNEECGSNTN